jgi:hypothetical protein
MERLDTLVAESFTRTRGGGSPERKRLMQEPTPLRGNAEASRRLRRPGRLPHPTTRSQQGQTSTHCGLIHFEVSRDVGGAKILHGGDQRQHSELVRANTERGEGVVEKARKHPVEHARATENTAAQNLTRHLPVAPVITVGPVLQVTLHIALQIFGGLRLSASNVVPTTVFGLCTASIRETE